MVLDPRQTRDLNTHLSDIPASSSSNQLALDLLLSARETLHNASSVAARCEGPSLSERNLNTQSDVDSVMARLDRHVKDADVLIKSTAARNLVIRLQIGEPKSKNSAIESLLREDDKNVMISIVQGVVLVQVRLLDSCSLSMKEKVVAVISRISTVESSKHVLIAEGLNHLLRVLESGSGF
ncbi:unnamed protein product [Brassica napus]|uniref:(rape) hypothetical protein n=1 Tax=Brassica napus TaxID=3708 RepID=A0A816YR31_BRANA|nr:unnamed protein product [Brassica napus]